MVATSMAGGSVRGSFVGGSMAAAAAAALTDIAEVSADDGTPVKPDDALTAVLSATDPTRTVLRLIGLDFVGGLRHLVPPRSAASRAHTARQSAQSPLYALLVVDGSARGNSGRRRPG